MRVHRFIKQHAEPADRMAGMIFGLVMALGVTGAIRLGTSELSSRELFVSIVGCNLAWGIVDGVVLVLTRIFERGRVSRMVRDARKAPDDERAYEIIERELSPEIVELMSEEERVRLKSLALGLLPRAQAKRGWMRASDLRDGAAAGLLVILPTLLVVLPYVFLDDALTAVRVSYVVALVLLFLIGVRWGHMVGGRPWRIGGSLVVLGIVLVVITVALGG